MVVNRIDEHYNNINNNMPRDYIGASVAGEPCKRKLHYSFRQADKVEIQPRTKRIFKRGHEEEKKIIETLKLVGLSIIYDGDYQKSFKFDEYMYCHPDGLVTKGYPYIDSLGLYALEIKTHNDKSFQELKKNGVEKSKPLHYAQCQLAIHGFKTNEYDVNECLYIALNKNDEEYYEEVIEYDPYFCRSLIDDIKEVIYNPTPPKKISDRKEFYLCKMCNFSDVCHSEKPPVKSCMTCKNISFTPNGKHKFTCKKGFDDLDWGICRQWENGIE